MRLRPPRHAGQVPGVRPHACRSNGVKRRLLNLVTVLSILLFEAVTALGVLSMSRRIDATVRESPASVVAIGMHRGGVYFLTVSSPRVGWRGEVPRVLDDWTV